MENQLSPTNELVRAWCESDAAWENYCRFPSQNTWDYYVLCKKQEKELTPPPRPSAGKESKP